MSKMNRLFQILGVSFLMNFAACDSSTLNNPSISNQSQIGLLPNKNISANRSDDDRVELDLVDKKLRNIGEQSLRSLSLKDNELEVRIWSGFGIRGTSGITLRKENEGWSGKNIEIQSFSDKGEVNRRPLSEPKSGWEELWRRIHSHNILDLRDDSEVGAVEPFEDSELVLIETLVGSRYRSYSYNAPCLSEATDGKELVKILMILTNEINENFFNCRRE